MTLLSSEAIWSLKEKEFINLTNVNGVYNKDPKFYKDARLIRNLSYADFGKLLSKVKEKPGQHFILDRLAFRIIKQNKIKVAILNGRDIKNLKAYLQGKRFAGSVIG